MLICEYKPKELKSNQAPSSQSKLTDLTGDALNRLEVNALLSGICLLSVLICEMGPGTLPIEGCCENLMS